MVGACSRARCGTWACFTTLPPSREGSSAGRQDDAPLRVSVMLLSCGNPVQPAAEADERADGAVDVPDAVQQPAPAAQRPGIGQVGDDCSTSARSPPPTGGCRPAGRL